MRCPQCNHTLASVIDSRFSKKEGTIRRRRQCLGCSYRYTTREILESEYRNQRKIVQAFNGVRKVLESFLKEKGGKLNEK